MLTLCLHLPHFLRVSDGTARGESKRADSAPLAFVGGYAGLGVECADEAPLPSVTNILDLSITYIPQYFIYISPYLGNMPLASFHIPRIM